jgi:hypothetical protein
MRQILIEKYIEPSVIKPETELNYKTECWFDINGDLHSFMGHPAAIYYENEKLISQDWYKKGEFHRDRDLPAIIEYYEDGQTSYQEWYKKGVLHRDGALPAYIGYNNGKISCQQWYKKGVYHRDGDLPAYVGYDSNGQISYQQWYKNGKLITTT